MDFDKKAWEIANEANECCNRADGYAENIQALVAAALKAAYNEGLRDSISRIEDLFKKVP